MLLLELKYGTKFTMRISKGAKAVCQGSKVALPTLLNFIHKLMQEHLAAMPLDQSDTL